ncbi:MAG: DUF1592 domain-containing protein [Planctomycetota bacterium]
MSISAFLVPRVLRLCAIAFVSTQVCWAQQTDTWQTDTQQEESQQAQSPSFAELKTSGLQRSRFKAVPDPAAEVDVGIDVVSPQPDTKGFDSSIKSLLDRHCVDCHGPDTVEGNIRIDTLDADLIHGTDTQWWSEVFAVVTNGEMPPPDSSDLSDAERERLVTWLSVELQRASRVRQRSGTRSAFRRLTNYEYNYALQDLLGQPWNFAKDLPPEARTEEGFENSSDRLHLSVSQLETYHRIARNALRRVTASGQRPPTRHWSISARDAAEREWARQDTQIHSLEKRLRKQPKKLAVELERLRERFEPHDGQAFFLDPSGQRKAVATWKYHGAKFAFAPREVKGNASQQNDCVAVLPNGRNSKLIFELGNQLPDEGTMRVAVRAWRDDSESDDLPSLQLHFGWQASNEGRALLRVSKEDVSVTGLSDRPQWIQWDVPLGEVYPRNSVRKTSPMGAMPSPSEYIKLVNSAVSKSVVHVDHVFVSAPVYDQWPPESHRRIFFADDATRDETSVAREIITTFMKRAWRRNIYEDEVRRKLALFETMRSTSDGFEEAVLEVLAAVLSSPNFLYVHNAGRESDAFALASRLSLFLWCSVPDDELVSLASSGRLTQPDVVAAQIDRMLADPRSDRFIKHFVHQWLDLELLEFQNFTQHQRGFDPLLKEAMLREAPELFKFILRENASVLDFLHCDYAIVNERLARHYGLPNVKGNHFRRVPLEPHHRRGGLLTQAGILAMNSDWPDSHPLKRAIWLLESVLADPPPPPPPAVPQIDLADPAIAKMSLKERIEDHRNHAACMSCHVKIDPWGIAFENYDAMGRWRQTIKGKPVDASSELFNHQTLDGMDGLKRFLLQNRQDQFVRATVSKLLTYALGRPLTFADQAEVDAITSRVRRGGDGLKTILQCIVQSELFQSRGITP